MTLQSQDPVSIALRQELQREIAAAARKGTLTLTDELMGYVFAGTNVSQSYAPRQRSVPKQRTIAAPEFLTGLVKNGIA